MKYFKFYMAGGEDAPIENLAEHPFQVTGFKESDFKSSLQRQVGEAHLPICRGVTSQPDVTMCNYI